jgi:multidrug efflux pump subunit AcrA (membrane-fusion protein)
MKPRVSHPITKTGQAWPSLPLTETELQALDVDTISASERIRAWEHVRLPEELIAYRGRLTKLLLIFLCLIGLVPWTQTVTVTGQISAYSPYDRPQHIESRIAGRVKRWHVLEGLRVKAGELLLELEDINPLYMAPDLVARLKQQRTALEEARAAAFDRAEQLDQRIAHMIRVLETAVPSAGARVQEGEKRVLGGEQRLLAARIAAETAQLNVDRQRDLAVRGLVSQRELDIAIQAAIASRSEFTAAQAALDQAQEVAKALTFDQARIEADAGQRLQQAYAERAAALAQAAQASDELAAAGLNLSNAHERRAASRIYAPADGTVVRMARLGPGETVKVGDVLINLSPVSKDPALEVMADSIDAPLLRTGRHVRLLFYGTPAVPLEAWPEEMAGTFAGVIQVVDQVSDDRGKFRLWVAPDPEDRPWPEQQHVRQGTPVMGWVIADRVPLILELLRRIEWLPEGPATGIEMIDKIVSKAGQKAVK